MSDFNVVGPDPSPDQTPRRDPIDSSAIGLDDLRPLVASRHPRAGPWWVAGGATAAGLVVFMALAARRDDVVDSLTTPPPRAGQQSSVSAAPPPSDLALEEAASRGAGVLTSPAPPPFVVADTPPPATRVIASAPLAQFGDSGAAQRLRAPALVVDLADTETPTSTKQGSLSVGPPVGDAAKVGGSGRSSRNGDEDFADRVSAAQPERSEATMLHNRSALIAQGVTITGVLETALNSDLPGFARAVVSRDVRGFDGSQVLIPRGSRVIGQYKSAVAQGQSRAFVIWTRIIRPDGASIQIGSSGTDPLGRAGMAGKVNTHFFQRFSGAILLSVVNAGIQSISRQPSTQIVIGSSQEAVTASLAALVPTAVPPTIKVAQGTAIRIFVARDLDFSPVQGGEP